MGLLSKLFGTLGGDDQRQKGEAPRSAAAAPPAPAWASHDWRHWDPPRNLVKGESHYTDTLRALTGSPRRNGWLVPVDVDLVREPRNRHDRNAVRAEVAGHLVGYLDALMARQLSGPMKTVGGHITVPGVIRGGWLDAPGLGVHVWLDRGEHEITLDGSVGGMVGNWPPEPAAGVDRDAELAQVRRSQKLAGRSVCFTGRSSLLFGGEMLTNQSRAELAERAGLVPVERLAKSAPPDLLVAASGAISSPTATRAAGYGCQVLDERDFWELLMVPVTPA